MDKLRSELERDEGREKYLYKDSEGIWTIACGWNIQERGLPDEIIDRLLDISIEEAERDARALFPKYDSLPDARQRVLCNMAFNLGRKRLSGFVKMRAAIAAGDYEEAARQMLDSKWARQVGGRADRLAVMMRDPGE